MLLAQFFTRCLIVILCTGAATPIVWASNNAETLAAKLLEIDEKLQKNHYDSPIHFETTIESNSSRGDIYGLLPYKFEQVATALQAANNWCDIVTLHLNVKLCLSRGASDDASLVDIYVGTKTYQELENAEHIQYRFHVAAKAANYFHSTFNAAKGPYGTSDYVIDVEAIPTADGKSTFVHFTYSYKFGFMSKLAMNVYLSTAGRSKVGFSISSYGADGKPEFVGGVQGVIERNAMRYYLAITAYLNALKLPESERFEQRIKHWFELTQDYSQQLYEIERAEYLDTKRQEREHQLKVVDGAAVF